MEMNLLCYCLLAWFPLVVCGNVKKGNAMCRMQNTSLIKDLDIYDELMSPITNMVEERTCNCVDDAIKAVKKELQKLQWRQKTMKSCLDWYKAGKEADGVYTIYPDGRLQTKAYCDMKNGGWTVIQRRVNGKVSFDRVWREYVKGFGDPNADYWLGLKHIHILTKHPNKISVKLLMKGTGKIASAVYEGFQVDDETTHFRMHVSDTGAYNIEMMKYVDSEGAGLYFHNGMMFTTKDADHDIWDKNCAVYGAWWHGSCYRIGKINSAFNDLYIYAGISAKNYKVSTSEIKIRENICIE